MKQPRGATRNETRRRRYRERRWLKRYGYATEWALMRWRWQRRRDALADGDRP